MDLTCLVKNFRLHPRSNGDLRKDFKQESNTFGLCGRKVTPAVRRESGGGLSHYQWWKESMKT